MRSGRTFESNIRISKDWTGSGTHKTAARSDLRDDEYDESEPGQAGNQARLAMSLVSINVVVVVLRIGTITLWHHPVSAG